VYAELLVGTGFTSPKVGMLSMEAKLDDRLRRLPGTLDPPARVDVVLVLSGPPILGAN
jgi:hypothetical protein